MPLITDAQVKIDLTADLAVSLDRGITDSQATAEAAVVCTEITTDTKAQGEFLNSLKLTPTLVK